MNLRFSVRSELLLPVFVVICFSFSATAQNKQVAANTPLAEAIRLMDRGQSDSSIVILKELLKAEPNDYSLHYELAFANYLKKDYTAAISILDPLLAHAEAKDQTYQLLGNAYDMSGKPDQAVETYKAGLVKYPKSGKLYLESGVMALKKNDRVNAITAFQNGVNAEPMFSSNYYWLTRLWLETEEEVWGMIFGELFMDLESNTNRTAEISKLLFDKYKSEIKVDGTGKGSVSFSKYAQARAGETNPDKMLPFGTGTYEMHLLTSLIGVKEININTLSDIRTGFVKGYFGGKSATLYPNVLFSYQKQLMDAGHLEAYNHWLLQKGDAEVFKAWVAGHNEQWTAFLKWFSTNRLKLNDTSKFDMTAYF